MADGNKLGLAAPGLTSLCTGRYDGADVQKTISCYNGHFAKTGKNEDDYQSRKEKYYDITQRKSFTECIHTYEEEIARTLKAKPGMKILVSITYYYTIMSVQCNYVYVFML